MENPNTKCEIESVKPQNLLLKKELSLSKDKFQEQEKLRSQALLRRQCGKTIQGSPKMLSLPQTLKLRESSSSPLIVREDESPWDTFCQVFDCKLAGTVVICVHRTRPSRIEAIREYPAEVAKKALQLFQQIKHENIISAKECYRDGDWLYARVDDLPLTLEHLASLLVSEHQLSSIIFQILNGLSYLATSGFEHTALVCSNILLGADGVVKIAALEMCEKRLPSQSVTPSIKALSIIMMRLMQKYEKDDGLIGVDDVERWPLDSHAVGFLTITSSAQSFEALQQHPFVKEQDRPWGNLVGLARFALIATRTFYSSKF